MASTRLSYLAVIPETTVATAVKPTNFIRYKEGDIILNKEIIVNNPIQNNRWGAISPVEGKVETKGTYMFDLDPNEVPYFLKAAMGTLVNADISSATDTSVYSHTFTLANSLPSLTIEQGKGNLSDTDNNLQNYQVDRAFGVMVDNITFTANDSIIDVSVDLIAHGKFEETDLTADATAGSSVDISVESVEGLTTSDTVNIYDDTPQNETDAVAAISTTNKTVQIATLGNTYTTANKAKIELVPQTPSYSVAPKPFTFCNVDFQFGTNLTTAASATAENVENWEFTYGNNLEERYGSLRCSPSKVAPKSGMSKLTFTKYFENVTDRDRYLRAEKRACIITITNGEVVSATDTNNATYKVEIKLSDLRFTSYTMETGTDELYAIDVEAESFYDSSDGSAVEIVVTNGTAGTGY